MPGSWDRESHWPVIFLNKATAKPWILVADVHHFRFQWFGLNLIIEKCDCGDGRKMCTIRDLNRQQNNLSRIHFIWELAVLLRPWEQIKVLMIDVIIYSAEWKSSSYYSSMPIYWLGLWWRWFRKDTWMPDKGIVIRYVGRRTSSISDDLARNRLAEIKIILYSARSNKNLIGLSKELGERMRGHHNTNIRYQYPILNIVTFDQNNTLAFHARRRGSIPLVGVTHLFVWLSFSCLHDCYRAGTSGRSTRAGKPVERLEVSISGHSPLRREDSELQIIHPNNPSIRTRHPIYNRPQHPVFKLMMLLMSLIKS
jgi:hypothetical protein